MSVPAPDAATAAFLPDKVLTNILSNLELFDR
jgi:hypothetical protein